METYPKINTLFKRMMGGHDHGKLIRGEWSTPEFEYLAANKWEFTEKVDGTNIRVWYDGPEKAMFCGGRTDKADVPKPLLEYLNSTLGVDEFMNAGLPAQTMLFGEGYGHKIQSGGKYRDNQSFVLFDVKVGDWWLQREDVDDVAAKLGLDSVPVIGYGTLQDAVDIVKTGITFTDTGAIKRWGINGYSGLTSQWGNFEAEGIVARPVVPMFDRKGERIITKIKGVDFK